MIIIVISISFLVSFLPQRNLVGFHWSLSSCRSPGLSFCFLLICWPSRLGLQNTPTTSLQIGKTSPSECPGYGTIQSDGEAQVTLKLWKMQITFLLPSPPCPLWPGAVALDRALFLYQIERNYAYVKLNCLK